MQEYAVDVAHWEGHIAAVGFAHLVEHTVVYFAHSVVHIAAVGFAQHTNSAAAVGCHTRRCMAFDAPTAGFAEPK